MELTSTADWQKVDAHTFTLTIGRYFAEVYYKTTTDEWGWHVRLDAKDDGGTLLAEGTEDDDPDCRDSAERLIRGHHRLDYMTSGLPTSSDPAA